MKGDSGNTAGPGLNTGGPGPAPSRSWAKSGGNQKPGGGDCAPNPGNIDAPDARSIGRDADERRGYTVLGKSPVQTADRDWGKMQGAQHPRGIDPNLERDGRYTGGRA